MDTFRIRTSVRVPDQHNRLSRIASRCAVAAATVAATATACGSSEAAQHTELIIDVGGPATPNDVDRLVDVIGDAVTAPGSTLTTTILDGPNAAVALRETPPGIDSSGALDTDAKTTTARKDDLAAVHDAQVAWVTEVLSSTTDLSNGRDLIGALQRAARQSPDRVVLFSTSGGVNRSETSDFLTDDPKIDVEFPSNVAVELINIGDIPADGTPSKRLTDSVTNAWVEWCDTYDNCEVTS